MIRYFQAKSYKHWEVKIEVTSPTSCSVQIGNITYLIDKEVIRKIKDKGKEKVYKATWEEVAQMGE